MQQIYRRTSMTKCDLNKFAKQIYWNHTSAWMISCKFTVYFQNTFYEEQLWMAASEIKTQDIEDKSDPNIRKPVF